MKPVKRPRLSDEGLLGRFRYYFGRAFANMKQNVFLSLVTTGTITLALLIVSLLLLVFVNIEGVAEGWSSRVQVTAYFQQELAPADAARLKSSIEALPGTASVKYVSRDEALVRFRERLKGQESLLEGVTPDVLPASLEIALKKASRTTEGTEAYVQALKRLPGITEVQFGEEWVRRFNSFLMFLRLLGAVLGVFLLLTVTFIVSNTIKLTIFARKDELELLSLVGATRFFIKAPFLIEGVVQGTVGALVSMVLLFGSYLALLNNAGNFLAFDPSAAGLVFLSPAYLLALLAGGALLGFLGSLSALKKFIPC
jgi:cell division transport system permease protein